MEKSEIIANYIKSEIDSASSPEFAQKLRDILSYVYTVSANGDLISNILITRYDNLWRETVRVRDLFEAAGLDGFHCTEQLFEMLYCEYAILQIDSPNLRTCPACNKIYTPLSDVVKMFWWKCECGASIRYSDEKHCLEQDEQQ